MTSIMKKIDFAVIFTVNGANPNGDPLGGNRPRTTIEGLGEVSDVCLKRKIRNRLQDNGNEIFVQSDDKNIDGKKSLRDRASDIKWKDDDEFVEKVCERWIDVRSFGQLFAFKSGNKKKSETEGDETKSESVSIGIRGPVSIRPAFSISPVNITSTQITKSVNSEDGPKKGSDTMGMKYRVDFGTYVFFGSINPQLAEKTGFSEKDADSIKEVLKTLFWNDSSSARPDGSMDVKRVYWWVHNSKNGQYSSAKVHDSLKIVPKIENPGKFEDYEIKLDQLPGLKPEIIEN